MPNNDVIDRLAVELLANSSAAVNAIKKVEERFATLKDALEGIKQVRLSGKLFTKTTLDNIKEFGDAIRQVDTGRVWIFADALRGLSGISGIKFSFNERSAQGLISFNDALSQVDMDRMREFAGIDFSNVQALGIAAQQFRGLGSELLKLQKYTEKAEKAQEQLRKALNQTKAATKSSSNAVKKHTGLLGKFFNSLKRIAFYRAIRSALRAITQGFSEGIENLYYWSQTVGTSFAPAMDRLATATQYLKNGFASMWSPLIEYAIPIIDRVIDRLVDFFNFIQEGFAQLTGAETWNRALKYPVQYADALADGAASAKEIKHQLLGFDELNVLNTPTNNSRSSGSDQKDYGAMFELVQTAAGNNFDGLGKRLADAVNDAFDDPDQFSTYGEEIAGAITSAFDNAIDFFVDVDWTKIGQSVTNFITSFNEKLEGWIEEKDFGQIVVDLTDQIVELLDGIDIIKIAMGITRLVMKLAATLPSILLGFAEAWHKLWANIFRSIGLNGFADTIDGWAESTNKARAAYENFRKETFNPWVDQLLPKDYDLGKTVSEGIQKIKDAQDAAKQAGDHGSGTSFGTDYGGAVTGGTFLGAAETMDISIKPKITGIGDAIKTGWEDFKTKWGDRFADVKSRLQNLKDKISQGWEDFKTKWGEKWADVKSRIQNVKTKLQEGWNNFKTAWGEKWADIKSRVQTTKTKLQEGWNTFKQNWGEKWADVKSRVQTLKTNITTGWNKFKTSWGTKWADVKSRVQTTAQNVKTGWQNFKTSWGTKYADLKSRVTEAAGAVKTGWSNFKTNWGTKYADAKSRVTEAAGAVKTGWSNFKTSWGDKFADAKSRVTSVASSIKTGWKSFTDSWGTDKNADVKSRVTSVATAAKNGWKAFVDDWGTKHADAKSRITSISDAIKTGWNTLTSTWNGSDRSVGVWVTFQNVLNGLADAWRTIWQTWNNSDRTLTYKVEPSTSSGNGYHGGGSSFKNGGFVGYASGGYPMGGGSLFWAGEGGIPELLGTVGGRTAVAGGAEITGIREAIVAQGAAERQMLGQLISAVANKDLTLVANSATGRWVNQSLRAYQGVTG